MIFLQRYKNIVPPKRNCTTKTGGTIQIRINEKSSWTKVQLLDFQGGVTGNRTRDTRIFSPLLYQLSYDTVPFGIANVGKIFYTANFSCILSHIFDKVCTVAQNLSAKIAKIFIPSQGYDCDAYIY